MSSPRQAWKTWTLAGLVLLLVADVALGAFLYEINRQGPEEMRLQRDRLALQARLLKADIVRGQKIRGSLPQVGKDCDAFYKQSFLDPITGYSDIETDLDSIAAKAKVKTSGLSFKQQEVRDRGVTEIAIGTTVDADYPAIIDFINGLERSKYFYLLDDVQMTPVAAGGIQLQIGLHTYFRT
jgi:hypothetical protein